METTRFSSKDFRPACQDCCDLHCGVASWELGIEVARLCSALGNGRSCIHETFEAHIPVAALPHIAPHGVRLVSNEEGIARVEPHIVFSHVVATVCLVDSHFGRFHLTEEALLRVDIRLAGCPRGGVQTMAQSPRIVLPSHSQCDGILTGSTKNFFRGSCGRCGVDANGFSDALHGPNVEVDMMGVQIVRDVGRDPSPIAEGLKLHFGL
eukprot:Skav224386  [mRNA]  locus=scaffold1155:357812:363625:+ [translate_table: standard]